MKKLLYILFSFVILAGCEPKIDELSPNKGSADFSRFVSVGNSMVAGLTDGALYFSAQQNSIPNLLAQQFQLAGGGAFVQPVVKSEFGVEFPGSMPRLKLGYVTDCTGAPSLGPVPDLGPRDPLQPVGYQVNNLGIPGAKSFHLLVPGYALLNPYYFRFATDPNNMVIQEIPPLNSTFFALWLGSNDVLGYAISGGVGDTITGQATFGPAMGGIVQSLVGTGTKGVIANIPDIHDIPFFTTIPYNGMVLPSQDIVDQVNFAMGHFGLPYTYQLGPNPFLVADPTSSRPVYKVRQMKPGELVLLTVPQDSLCLGMGLISSITLTPWPLPDQFVLTQDEIKDEITNIETAIAGYNVIITGLAQTNGLALVDMNTKLKELESGLVWDGIHMNANFVTGGVFSLDGIHLNSRGNAIAANYFIESINAEYGSTIPFVDITKYQGVLFP